MILLENILITSYIFQFSLIVGIIVLSIYFEITTKLSEQLTRELRELLLNMFEQQMFIKHLPKKYCSLKLVVPLLEEFDGKMSGYLWEHMKDEIVHTFLAAEIEYRLKKKRWVNKAWAMRALIIAPNKRYETVFIEHLNGGHSFLRTLAIQGAIVLETKGSLKGILDQLKDPDNAFHFPYLDAFLKASNRIWTKLYAIYKEDDAYKDVALRILCKRSGFLTLDDIRSHLDGPVRQYAIEALKNIPSEETTKLLQELAGQGSEKDKLMALFILGRLRIPVKETFHNGTKDCDKHVRLASLWSLRFFDEPLPDIEEKKHLETFPQSEIERHLETIIYR